MKACLAPHEAAGEAFNIAYGGREYLLDIYYGLTKALGVDVEPNFGPDRAGDIKHSNADISIMFKRNLRQAEDEQNEAQRYAVQEAGNFHLPGLYTLLLACKERQVQSEKENQQEEV